MAYILIVDDDEDFANAVSTVMQNDGHETHLEHETDGVIKNMEEKRPDLVILDVMFPDNSSAGFELARSIKREGDKFKGIPILMLTAVNEDYPPLGFTKYDIDDQWLPVSDFVEKPIDFDVLRNKVTELLNKVV